MVVVIVVFFRVYDLLGYGARSTHQMDCERLEPCWNRKKDDAGVRPLRVCP